MHLNESPPDVGKYNYYIRGIGMSGKYQHTLELLPQIREMLSSHGVTCKFNHTYFPFFAFFLLHQVDLPQLGHLRHLVVKVCAPRIYALNVGLKACPQFLHS